MQSWEQPFVNVFKYAEDNVGGLKRSGDSKQVVDRVVGRNVWALRGSIPANNTLTVPASSKGLGLHGQYLYLALSAVENKQFVFHIDVVLKGGSTCRVSFSSLWKKDKAFGNHVQIALGHLLSARWTIVALDLGVLLLKATGFEYDSIRSFQFCSNLLVRGALTSNEVYDWSSLPLEICFPERKGHELSELYSWVWFPTVSSAHIPTANKRAVSTAKQAVNTDLDVSRASSCIANHSRVSHNASLNASAPLPEASFNVDLLAPHDLLNAETASPPLISLKQVIGYGGSVKEAVKWIDSGKHLVYATGSSVVVMNASSRQQSYLFGHSSNVEHVSFSKDTRLLATCENGSDPHIRLWSLDDANEECPGGRCVSVLRENFVSIRDVTFSSDGKCVCAAGTDVHNRTLIVLWQLKTESTATDEVQATVHVRHTTDISVHRISFFPYETNRLATCGKGSIHIWRIKDGERLLRGVSIALGKFASEQFTCLGFEFVFGIAQVQDRRLFVGSQSGRVHEVDHNDRKLRSSFRLHDKAITAFSVNEGFCVTGSADNFMRIWPLDFSEFFLEAEHEGVVQSIDVSDDGLRVLIGTGNGCIGVLDVGTQTYQTIFRSHTDKVIAMDSDPQHREFSTVACDGTLRVWDLDTYDQLYQFDVEGDRATSISYHPFDYVLACGFESGITRIFDIETTTMIHEYQGHSTRVGDLVYTTDGKWLVSGARDGICMSEVASGYRPMKFFKNTAPAVDQRIAFARSSDGKFLASVGPEDTSITVFKLQDMSIERRLAGLESERFSFVRFSPDAIHVYGGTAEGDLVEFDLPSGRVVSSVSGMHSEGLLAFDMLKNGQCIFTGGKDALLRTWLPQNGAVDRWKSESYLGHMDAVEQISVSSDSANIISSGSSPAIYIWEYSGARSTDPSIIVDQLAAKTLNATVSSSSDHDEHLPVLDDLLAGLEEAPSTPSVSTVTSKSAASRVGDASVVARVEEKHCVHGAEDAPRPVTGKQFDATGDATGVRPSELVSQGRESSKIRPDRVLGCNRRGQNIFLWNPALGMLAYGCGSTLVVEDIRNRSQRLLSGHRTEISCVRQGPQQNIIATSSGWADATGSAPIVLWNARTFQSIRTLQYHAVGVQAMDFSPDGSLLVSVGVVGDNDLVVWNVSDGKPEGVSVLKGNSLDVRFIPFASREFMTVGEDSVSFWMIADDGSLLVDHAKLAKKKGSPRYFTCIGFSEAFPTLAFVGSSTGDVLVFSLETNDLVSTFSVGPSIQHLEFAGAKLIVACGENDDLNVLRYAVTGTGSSVQFELMGGVHIAGDIVSLNVDLNGDESVVSTSCGAVWFVDFVSSSKIKLVSGFRDGVKCIGASEKMFSTVGHAGELKCWSSAQSLLLTEPAFTLSGPVSKAGAEGASSTRSVTACMPFSNPAELMAVGCDDGAVAVVNVVTGAVVSQTYAHTSPISVVELDPSQKVVISGSEDGLLVLSDVTTGGVLFESAHHDGVCIQAIDVNPKDPESFCVSSNDGRVSLWTADWASGKVRLAATLSLFPDVTAGGPPSPVSCRFSRVDPNLLYVTGIGTQVAVLSVDRRKVVSTIDVERAAALCIATTAHGDIAVGCADGTMRVYDEDSRSLIGAMSVMGPIRAISALGASRKVVAGTPSGAVVCSIDSAV